jgi:hypothetical protein
MEGKAVVWTGRVISTLAALVFVMSGAMKLLGGPEVTAGLAHLGIPEGILFPLAIVELACVAVYAVPQTAVLGAILLTGYIGGAICAHARVGDSIVTAAVIGVLVWVGLYLRDPGLQSLLPLRRSLLLGRTGGAGTGHTRPS